MTPQQYNTLAAAVLELYEHLATLHVGGAREKEFQDRCQSVSNIFHAQDLLVLKPANNPPVGDVEKQLDDLEGKADALGQAPDITVCPVCHQPTPQGK